jgi:hypothetical protein
LHVSYKNPPQAVVEEFEDERTGQTRARYVNKARFVGHTPAHVGSVFPGIEVPKEPPKSVLSAAAKLDQNLLIKMRKVGIGLSLPFVRSGARAPFEIVILISRRSSWRDRCGNDLLSSAN